MTRVQVELLTDQGNDAVLRLPDRRSPGILLQGDSLFRISSLVSAAAEGLEEADTSEANDAIRAVAMELHDMRQRYEAALNRHEIPLPY